MSDARLTNTVPSMACRGLLIRGEVPECNLSLLQRDLEERHRLHRDLRAASLLRVNTRGLGEYSAHALTHPGGCRRRPKKVHTSTAGDTGIFRGCLVIQPAWRRDAYPLCSRSRGGRHRW